jgi:hypothetical protein
MNWYYVDAGQQAGPVDDAQLAALVESGKVQGETLVWREGMGNWAPYREVFPPSAQAGAGAPPVFGAPAGDAGAGGNVICSECGRSFAPSEVIRYGDKNICASCKPLFFQRLSEGAALGGGAGVRGNVTEADLLARDYEVDIGGYLSRSWDLFKANAGMMIGASVLVGLAYMGVAIAAYVLRVSTRIPLLSLASIVVTAPLIAGLWLFYVKVIRGENPDLGVAFSGFGPRFGQIVLTQLIPTLLNLGFAAVLAAMGLAGVLAFPRVRAGQPPTLPSLAPLFGSVGVVLLVYFIVMTYLSVCWMFALPLAADKGLKFWPAMELSRRVVSKHWWMTFWLLVVSGVFWLIGFFLCLVGVLVTGPVSFSMVACHYDRLFGDLTPADQR